jgi:hypothetical protein
VFDITVLRATAAMLAARLTPNRYNERGEVTEKVIITAIFAALAIAIGAIIVAKVTAKANSIPTQ